MSYSVIMACVLAGLWSCAPQIKEQQRNKDPYGLLAYQRAGGRIATLGGASSSAAASGVSWSEDSGITGMGITPEQDIVWAPEDPDMAIGGDLVELWQKPANKTWHLSFREASQQSKQTGKPMLLWFTDSMHSPLCRKLSEELFSTAGFESWASANIIRLRVDMSVAGTERNSQLGIRKMEYAKKLKKRFGVNGHPTVFLLMPGGEMKANYRGYRAGEHDYYWARMKQAVVVAQREYGKWREKYESRGYRLWTSRDGRKTFAKLYRFRPGKVTLIDPDGERGTTSFNRLSDADQAWILQQKKKYEDAKGE